MKESTKQTKERYRPTPEDVLLASETMNGLMEIEIDHELAAAQDVLRTLEKRGIPDSWLIPQILACGSADTLLVAYARRRMKSKWWPSLVDAIVDLDPSDWSEISHVVRDRKLLPIVCSDEGLEYIWRNRMAVISNPQHPLFERISFDAYYRRIILHFLHEGDDRRAWQELVRACRGIPYVWPFETTPTKEQRAYRCYRASKTTLIVLVASIFDDLVTRRRIGEIRPHERNMPKLPPDLEPLVAGAIGGTYDRHEVFHYEPAAVKAMKLDEHYRKRRSAALRRGRAKASPPPRSSARSTGKNRRAA